jgi:hypothetical protein
MKIRLASGVFAAVLFAGASPALANPSADLVRAALACAIAMPNDFVDQNALQKDGWHLETANTVAMEYATGLGLTAYGRGVSTANILVGSYDKEPICSAIGPISQAKDNEAYAAAVVGILKPQRTVRDGSDYVMLKLGRIFVLNLPSGSSERIAVIRVIKKK